MLREGGLNVLLHKYNMNIKFNIIKLGDEARFCFMPKNIVENKIEIADILLINRSNTKNSFEKIYGVKLFEKMLRTIISSNKILDSTNIIKRYIDIPAYIVNYMDMNYFLQIFCLDQEK